MAAMICGNSEIKIIQGDSYQMNVTVEGIAPEVIESVIFTCEGLKLCKKLQAAEGTFMLKFSPEETAALDPITSNYDLTVNFKDSNIRTVVHNSNLRILEKINKVDCNG